MKNKKMEDNLIELLTAGHAHITLEKSLKGLKSEMRNKKPSPEMHSVWELLEHIRISQEDILLYTINPEWESPSWPDGYWPAGKEAITDEMWNKSISKFTSDLEELINLVKDPDIDLTSEIPHGEGRTYLREVMLAADHNSYHIGQIVAVRKMLGDWNW